MAIARAMVVEPRFVVADEPTSMLDVSVRAGIMDLLLGLTRDFQVSFLYITHDFAEDVLEHPLHPYTQALIAAVPVPDPAYRRPEARRRVPRRPSRSARRRPPGSWTAAP